MNVSLCSQCKMWRPEYEGNKVAPCVYLRDYREKGWTFFTRHDDFCFHAKPIDNEGVTQYDNLTTCGNCKFVEKRKQGLWCEHLYRFVKARGYCSKGCEI